MNEIQALCLLRHSFDGTLCFYYEQEEERLQSQYASSKQKGILPQSNYQDKYKHLIGETSAKEAAQSTQTNRSYGFGMYSKPVTYGPQH